MSFPDLTRSGMCKHVEFLDMTYGQRLPRLLLAPSGLEGMHTSKGGNMPRKSGEYSIGSTKQTGLVRYSKRVFPNCNETTRTTCAQHDQHLCFCTLPLLRHTIEVHFNSNQKQIWCVHILQGGQLIFGSIVLTAMYYHVLLCTRYITMSPRRRPLIRPHLA